jgi:hypothetical protein
MTDQTMCICPKVPGTTLRGYDPSCPVHGAEGTDPARRPSGSLDGEAKIGFTRA